MCLRHGISYSSYTFILLKREREKKCKLLLFFFLSCFSLKETKSILFFLYILEPNFFYLLCGVKFWHSSCNVLKRKAGTEILILGSFSLPHYVQEERKSEGVIKKIVLCCTISYLHFVRKWDDFEENEYNSHTWIEWMGIEHIATVLTIQTMFHWATIGKSSIPIIKLRIFYTLVSVFFSLLFTY